MKILIAVNITFLFCICAYRPYYKALERRYKLDTLFFIY